MKTIKSVVLAIVLLLGTTVSASDGLVKKKKATTVSQEISQLLKNPSFKVSEEISTEATFVINDDGEIVILSVDTENAQIERYVKNRLNYQKLQNNLKQGTQYHVPIRIVSS